MDRYTLEGAETGFGVNTLGSLKVGGCCGFSAEDSFENMESICKSDLRVMVSDGGSIGFLLICINAAVNCFAVIIILSVAVAVGVMSLWEKQETIFPMWTGLVAGIQI